MDAIREMSPPPSVPPSTSGTAETSELTVSFPEGEGISADVPLSPPHPVSMPNTMQADNNIAKQPLPFRFLFILTSHAENNALLK